MKKKLGILCCALMAVFFAIGATEVKAAKLDNEWNYESDVVVTSGAFTYYAVSSLDEKEIWIYKIGINTKEKYNTLSIPEVLDNKLVTHLGYLWIKDPDREDCNSRNIFGKEVDIEADLDGCSKVIGEIGELNIPQSVEIIGPRTFSGLRSVTTVTIPEKVAVIDEQTFYGCESLKEVYLPNGLEELKVTAFTYCTNIKKMRLSSKNKIYKIKDNCIITKKDNAVVNVLPKRGTLKIPKGVKIVKQHAFHNCTSSKVEIPATVIDIEGKAFERAYDTLFEQRNIIKNITISKKNKVYAKDGQCIYNKKKKTLAVAIPDNKGELYISEKVQRLTEDYSIINCKADMFTKNLKKVVFPKNLKVVKGNAFELLNDASRKYFKGKNPPKMKNVKKLVKEGRSILPKYYVYVPKDSYHAYKNWYKKYKQGTKVKTF